MEQSLLVWVLVIVPVLSVCLGVTVHYAIRPLVEVLLEAVHELKGGSSLLDDSRRLLELESEVEQLRAELRALRASSSATALPTTDGEIHPPM